MKPFYNYGNAPVNDIIPEREMWGYRRGFLPDWEYSKGSGSLQQWFADITASVHSKLTRAYYFLSGNSLKTIKVRKCSWNSSSQKLAFGGALEYTQLIKEKICFSFFFGHVCLMTCTLCYTSLIDVSDKPLI